MPRRKRTSNNASRSWKQRRSDLTNAFPVLATVVVVCAVAAVFALVHPMSGAAGGGPPPKPSGTGTVSSTEQWTLAHGLPKQTLALAFSIKTAGLGFAAAFENKTTQTLYSTADNGSTWTYVSRVQAPVADALAIDPTNPQDLALLSYNAPAPGIYTLQRSTDGGRTWRAQTTSLPSPATISVTGWADSTLVIDFQLDRQPTGDNALVAFPVSAASLHLDVDGKINGRTLPHVQLLTGHNLKLYIWGVDDSQTPHPFGIATANLGKTWEVLSPTAAGVAVTPISASAEGGALLALTTDRTRVAISNDGGQTWSLQPAVGLSTSHASSESFVTSIGLPLLHVTDGEQPGMYTQRNGAWVKVTDRHIIAISSDATGHFVRLWSYDPDGLVAWINL